MTAAWWRFARATRSSSRVPPAWSRIGVYAFGGVAVSPDGTLVAAKYWKPTGSKINPHGYYDGAWRVSDGQVAWTTTQIGWGQTEVPGHVIFSLDGTLIAFGYGSAFDGPRLLHASDGSLVRTLGTEPVAFSADGLALLGYPLTGGYLQIIRLSDGVVDRTITVPTTNSKPLAARFGTGTTTVSVIDPGGTGPLQLFTDGTQTGSVDRLGWQYTVAGVAIPPDDYFPVKGVLSPDGTREALTGNSAVSVMQVKSGGVRLSVPVLLFTITLPASTNAVAFSPDGTLIATGDTNDTAALWSASDGSLVYQHTWDLNGPMGYVTAVAFSPDGARVVTAGSDATVNFWDVASGANVKTISAAPGALGSVSFSPDGSQLIGSYLPSSKITRIWDVNSGLVVGSLPGSSNPVLDGSQSLLFIGNPGGGIELQLPGPGRPGNSSAHAGRRRRRFARHRRERVDAGQFRLSHPFLVLLALSLA